MSQKKSPKERDDTTLFTELSQIGLAAVPPPPKGLGKLWAWLRMPHAHTILVASFFVIVVPIIAVKSGKIGYPDSSVKPGEISLVGTWKIRYADDPSFADPRVSDSNWCLAALPNPIKKVVAGAGDAPAADCPEDLYPIQKMRNSTYWYRKWVDIPPGASWSRPSLFLGAVKHEAWIYWDGKEISRGTYEQSPIFMGLSSEEARPGRHLLAVRVRTGATQYPGLVHAHARGMAIGEFGGAVASNLASLSGEVTEPLIALLMQFFALLLLFYFVIRSSDENTNFLWLSLYFGSSAACSASLGLSGDLRWFLDSLTLTWMSIALAGYGLYLFRKQRPDRSGWKLTLFFSMLAVLLLQLGAFAKGDPKWLGANAFAKVAIFASLILLVERATYFVIVPWFSKRAAPKIVWTDFATFSVLLFLHSLNGYGRVSGTTFLHVPIFSAVLTFLVIAFAIEDYVNKEKHLVFFGRFLRSGLKALLSRHSDRAFKGEKILQGRKVVLLKIDIIGHTETTFGMPYGMKRLYQDTWFTEIDRLVAEHSFTDKPEGDGSFYYFAEEVSENIASFVLDIALKIENEAIPRFDRLYRERVAGLLSRTPDIEIPARKFFERYHDRTGHDFWNRRTEVRFVLVYGYVDEGLWGMISRGHYEVHGDLITLAARLEKRASQDTLVFSREFVEKLRSENYPVESCFDLSWVEEDLKGVGSHPFGLAKKRPRRNVA